MELENQDDDLEDVPATPVVVERKHIEQASVAEAPSPVGTEERVLQKAPRPRLPNLEPTGNLAVMKVAAATSAAGDAVVEGAIEEIVTTEVAMATTVRVIRWSPK